MVEPSHGLGSETGGGAWKEEQRRGEEIPAQEETKHIKAKKTGEREALA